MSADFDRYQKSYRDEVQRSIDFMGQELDFFVEAKVDSLLDIAGRRP